MHIFHRHRHAPDDLWVQCAGCKQLIYRREFENNLQTCSKCNHHGRLSAVERIETLVDPGTWEEEDPGLIPGDPLQFVSLGQTYPEKVAETQEKTGLNEAVLTGRAAIEGAPIRLAVCDFGFLGASMGSVVGEKIARAAERSGEDQRPLILVSSSGGARMHEGIYSLMQMAKTSAALARLGHARVPCISLLTDPTTGGVTASFASLGDVILAEPGALVGFAGPRVIEQTTKQKLPPDAQRPEFLLKHGMIDTVVHRRELRTVLTKVLRLFAGGPCADLGSGKKKTQTTEASRRSELLAGEAPDASTLDPWSAVQLARNTNRPFALDYIGIVFSEFLELHGDREFADDPAIVAGLASLDGRTLGVVGHQKGRTTQDRLERRFGMARPEGYRKALRVMRAAEKFGFPVVTFIDTPGADPSLEAEERGQAWAIAQNLAEMVELRVPTVALVIGEGGSGGALGIGVGDRLLMMEHSIYSVAMPEACASILWRDIARKVEAADALKLTANDLKRLGLADEIVPEPPGGAHNDYGVATDAAGAALRRHLGALEAIDIDRLVEERYQRYRKIGA